MRDYILNRDENGMVRYLYGKDRRYPVVGKTKWASARWMLENDRKREIRMSEEFDGYPLTADGVYFFDGCLGGRPPSQSPSVTALPLTGASQEGSGADGSDSDAPVCGPDWCEIPELAVDEAVGEMIPAGVNADVVKVADIGAGKPRRRKRDERPTAGRTEGERSEGLAARNSPPSAATGARRLKDVQGRQGWICGGCMEQED